MPIDAIFHGFLQYLPKVKSLTQADDMIIHLG